MCKDQVQKARHTVANLQPDIIIAIRGGSTIGLAKAVALKHPIPVWALPTTYSGSEMTDIYGISSADINEKLLLRACYGGKALAEAEMGLHHKCAHVL